MFDLDERDGELFDHDVIDHREPDAAAHAGRHVRVILVHAPDNRQYITTASLILHVIMVLYYRGGYTNSFLVKF